MCVILPGKYPYQAPICQIIKAKVVHKFLDDQMRVVHQSLVNWDPKTSLVQVIKEIHREFNDEPPKLKKTDSSKKVEEQKQATLIQKPDMDQIDKAIKQLSQDQMKTLLEDDEFFNDYFVGLPGVETLSTNVATIMKGLHSQAEENLKAKQQLETEIEQHDVLYSEYEALAREHEKLKAQKEKIMGKFSSANIVSAVKERKAEADQNEKELASQF